MKRKTTEQFVSEASKLHSDLYDYSQVCYINSRTKVNIICKKHGAFKQSPNKHLMGRGCPECSRECNTQKRKGNTESFIDKSILKNGYTYNYDKVEYVDDKTKVLITCGTHGDFWQTPSDHLQGKGCMKCGRLSTTSKQTSNTEEFIEKSKVVHGDRYDYSKVEYGNARKNVTIICSKHGEFEQSPDNHLHGKGCGQCAKEYLLEDKFSLNDAGILYYVRITRDDKTYYKIGVTKYDVSTRFKDEKNIKVDVLQVFEFGRVGDAYKEELKILNNYRHLTTKSKPLDRGGNTEVFDSDILGLDQHHTKLVKT